jgi:RHS repeat-associated protein
VGGPVELLPHAARRVGKPAPPMSMRCHTGGQARKAAPLVACMWYTGGMACSGRHARRGGGRGSMAYEVRPDANLDGVVDASDATHANSITGGYQALGRGVLSSVGVESRVGYAGYRYDPHLGSTGRHWYPARHRWYMAEVGRWMTRDPLGYVQGMSLYQYVLSQPILRTDPSGLLSPAPSGSIGLGCSMCSAGPEVKPPWTTDPDNPARWIPGPCPPSWIPPPAIELPPPGPLPGGIRWTPESRDTYCEMTADAVAQRFGMVPGDPCYNAVKDAYYAECMRHVGGGGEPLVDPRISSRAERKAYEAWAQCSRNSRPDPCAAERRNYNWARAGFAAATVACAACIKATGGLGAAACYQVCGASLLAATAGMTMACAALQACEAAAGYPLTNCTSSAPLPPIVVPPPGIPVLPAPGGGGAPGGGAPGGGRPTGVIYGSGVD